jgi:hypothetical protein
MDNPTLALILALAWLFLLRPVAKSIFTEEGERPPLFMLPLNLLAVALLVYYAFVWAAQEVVSPAARVPLP